MLHSWPVPQLALLVHPVVVVEVVEEVFEEAFEEVANVIHTKLTQSWLIEQSAAVKQVVVGAVVDVTQTPFEQISGKKQSPVVVQVW